MIIVDFSGSRRAATSLQDHLGLTNSQADPSRETAVQAHDVGRRYGSAWAIRQLTFDLPQGHTLLVVGGNGSGKSTLLRLILGLDRPDTGSLTVLGGDPCGTRTRSNVAALLHDDAVYPQLTVAETVRLWCGISGSRRGPDELLQAVDLADAADRRVAALSAGMRKRLALTRTLMLEPRLVVWDEPLSSLDAAGRTLVIDLVRKLRQELVSVVMASHERDLFAASADQVLNLDTDRDRSGLSGAPG